MSDKVTTFYEELADSYHLLFEDWDASIKKQADVLSPLLANEFPGRSLKILDCSCGIGTQSLGFAMKGHQVVGSDISAAAIARARREAQLRSLDSTFLVADMTSLQEIPAHAFDVVASLDNALPHLSALQLEQAAKAIASSLKPGGLFMASIRDYDALLLERPTMQPPAFFKDQGRRRIVHQVWDWVDELTYILHLYITVITGPDGSTGGWQVLHFVSEYRSLRRAELSGILGDAGFNRIQWLMPAESGFYQPLLLAHGPD